MGVLEMAPEVASAPAAEEPRDWSGDSFRHIVVADGHEEYQGHPTTVALPDGRTVWCVWSLGHGGPCGPLKKSSDQGQTWSELWPTPDNWREFVNCPTIWRMPTPEAPNRLVVFAVEPKTKAMSFAEAEDGVTWTPMRVCGGGEIVTIMPWCSVVSTGGGRWLAFTNVRDPDDPFPASNRIIRARSEDGGRSWHDVRAVMPNREARLCEPWIVASPDGGEWACLLRANNRDFKSMVSFSRDQGESWTTPAALPSSLCGDRHVARYLPDGRLLVVFRDLRRCAFNGWVGSWEALRGAGTPGRTHILLRHCVGEAGDGPYGAKPGPDIGYPGLEVFPDGWVLATTYLRHRPADRGNSVVSVRFPASLLMETR